MQRNFYETLHCFLLLFVVIVTETANSTLHSHQSLDIPLQYTCSVGAQLIQSKK